MVQAQDRAAAEGGCGPQGLNQIQVKKMRQAF
jgi:hypothetical protein